MESVLFAYMYILYGGLELACSPSVPVLFCSRLYSSLSYCLSGQAGIQRRLEAITCANDGMQLAMLADM